MGDIERYMKNMGGQIYFCLKCRNQYKVEKFKAEVVGISEVHNIKILHTKCPHCNTDVFLNMILAGIR